MGADFIGMTILGTLNAAIGRQNIRPELSYSHQVSVACFSAVKILPLSGKQWLLNNGPVLK